jgi:hypothetical protein
MLINNKLVYKNATYYAVLIEKETGILASTEARILLYDTSEQIFDESPISVEKIDTQFLPAKATLGYAFEITMTINSEHRNMSMSISETNHDDVYQLFYASDYISTEMKTILKQIRRDIKIEALGE